MGPCILLWRGGFALGLFHQHKHRPTIRSSRSSNPKQQPECCKDFNFWVYKDASGISNNLQSSLVYSSAPRCCRNPPPLHRGDDGLEATPVWRGCEGPASAGAFLLCTPPVGCTPRCFMDGSGNRFHAPHPPALLALGQQRSRSHRHLPQLTVLASTSIWTTSGHPPPPLPWKRAVPSGTGAQHVNPPCPAPPPPHTHTHLRVRRLREQAAHGLVVPRQHHGLHLAAHVPHAHHAVAAARHKHLQVGVQRQAVHARQVAVVGADDLGRSEKSGEWGVSRVMKGNKGGTMELRVGVGRQACVQGVQVRPGW